MQWMARIKAQTQEVGLRPGPEDIRLRLQLGAPREIPKGLPVTDTPAEAAVETARLDFGKWPGTHVVLGRKLCVKAQRCKNSRAALANRSRGLRRRPSDGKRSIWSSGRSQPIQLRKGKSRSGRERGNLSKDVETLGDAFKSKESTTEYGKGEMENYGASLECLITFYLLYKALSSLAHLYKALSSLAHLYEYNEKALRERPP